MRGRGFTESETDSEGVEVSSRGEAMARDMGRLVAGLNAGDPATVQGFVGMMKQAGTDGEMAGVFNMVLDQLDAGPRAAILEAAGGGATAEAMQSAEAEVDAAKAAQGAEARKNQTSADPRFRISTYGGAALTNRLKSYGTADVDRGQVSSVARDELAMIRNWQRNQLVKQGMDREAAKKLSDSDLTELAGMPSAAEFYKMADAQQAEFDRRIGGSAEDLGDSGLVGGHLETALPGTLSTADSRLRILDSLLEAESAGGARPLLNIPRTFPWAKGIRFPQPVLDNSATTGIELKYPDTQMTPDYYTGLFLDSLGVQPTTENLGKYRPLIARSIDHYFRLPPETSVQGRGRPESAFLNEYAVPEVKGGIPILRRMAELDAGQMRPSRPIKKHQKGLLALRPHAEGMFTDKPINRGDNAPFFLKDVLIDRQPAAEAAPVEMPPPDAPMPADNETSMMDYRNLPPQLLQMLLA